MQRDATCLREGLEPFLEQFGIEIPSFGRENPTRQIR